MSELRNAAPENYRRQLFAGVSALALLASICGTRATRADDTDRPIIWLDLGGAFDQMSRGETSWLPPNLTPPISNPPLEPFGRVPSVGYDLDAAISFQPGNSDWIYSVSVRYGRAKLGPKQNHDQTYVLKTEGISHKYVLTNYDFANATQQSHSSHAILDFNVGREVGIGAFNDGKVTIHFGVRVAQLNEKSDADLIAFISAPAKYSPSEVSHTAEANISRSFAGAGPAISWDVETPILGSLKDGISLDWRANAAILFGRQKTHIALHTRDAQYYKPSGNLATRVLMHSTATPVRDKTVIVPNVGGLVGLSYRRSNAKVSFGYRADFFFGALDGGLATSQKDTRGFYGPFANISIGIGG
jgi:hypothetical protein